MHNFVLPSFKVFRPKPRAQWRDLLLSLIVSCLMLESVQKCIPDFHGVSDPPNDQVMVVGELDLEIETFFEQEPCFYDEEYSFKITNLKTNLVLNPPPALFEQFYEFFLVGVPTSADMGEFQVDICNKLVGIN